MNLYVAPKSTEVQRAWGSSGTTRLTISTTNGVANTTTLFNLGAAAHPAAYYCRALSTGGYNTWYLPASLELKSVGANHLATPFATSDDFISGGYYWSSTESNTAQVAHPVNVTDQFVWETQKSNSFYVRAARRSTI
jgi:hypothetical protein